MSATFSTYDKAMFEAKTRSLKRHGSFCLIQTGAATFEVVARIDFERKVRGMICAVYKDGKNVAPLVAIGVEP